MSNNSLTSAAKLAVLGVRGGLVVLGTELEGSL